jgi:hypothetical protein
MPVSRYACAHPRCMARTCTASQCVRSALSARQRAAVCSPAGSKPGDAGRHALRMARAAHAAAAGADNSHLDLQRRAGLLAA